MEVIFSNVYNCRKCEGLTYLLTYLFLLVYAVAHYSLPSFFKWCHLPQFLDLSHLFYIHNYLIHIINKNVVCKCSFEQFSNKSVHNLVNN